MTLGPRSGEYDTTSAFGRTRHYVSGRENIHYDCVRENATTLALGRMTQRRHSEEQVTASAFGHYVELAQQVQQQ